VKVSFLMPDMNCPVLGPVTVLARHVQKHMPVEVVGPDLGHGVCGMYRDSFPYTVVPCPRIYRFPDYFHEVRKLADAVTGNVIIPVKAIGDTIPVALGIKRRRGCRVVPYLDEWDGALMAQLTPAQRCKRWWSHWHHPVDDVYFPWVEKLIPHCDSVISTSTFLQRRFGGQLIPMGVNTDFFKPISDGAANALRRELKVDGLKLVVFGGVVRPHKGIELILAAIHQVGDPALRFLVVGPINEHVQALCAHPEYGSRIITVGAQPSSRMPEFLSLADIIALPLQDTLLAQSQVPCKIFEAMAMGRPIIGTAVSDIPVILQGCGWVVPPGDVSALAAAMREVLGDPVRAVAAGQLARKRCLDRYSQQVSERLLVKLLESLHV
jgi:glycosyltransferase involved in cell wall biosynthesis